MKIIFCEETYELSPLVSKNQKKEEKKDMVGLKMKKDAQAEGEQK